MSTNAIYTEHRNLIMHSWIFGTDTRYVMIGSYKNIEDLNPLDVIIYEIY